MRRAKAAGSSEQFPKPTLSNVSYGPESKQKLHFWKADSTEPTGVVVHIHGGGWNGGKQLNKNLLPVLQPLLDQKISVASIEYRKIKDAVAQEISPPVKAPMLDGARAVQFVRSQAKDWNIDPDRLAVFGGSAGGCTSLWLAFHDDLAQPDSEDPVAQESTRPNFVAVLRAQTTLDPIQMRQWTPEGFYGAHAFGIIYAGKENREKSIQEFLTKREELLPEIKEYSPYELASSDDPPVYLFYPKKPSLGKREKDPTHSANYGVKLQEHLQSLEVACELVYPGARM